MWFREQLEAMTETFAVRFKSEIITKMFQYFPPREEFMIPEEYFDLNPHLERHDEKEWLWNDFYDV